MARHKFTREECQAAGRKRAAQESAQAARRRGGQTRAAQPNFRNAGVAGFAATAARYGIDFARKKAAAKRRAAPPAAQAQVGRWLDAWGYVRGLDYWTEDEAQIWIAGRDYYPDYVLSTADGARLIIEVDGPFHDPAADAARDAALRALGYPTLRLPVERVERAPSAAQEQLWDALQAAAAEWDPGQVAA